jgi:hypothetical protein
MLLNAIETCAAMFNAVNKQGRENYEDNMQQEGCLKRKLEERQRKNKLEIGR